MACAVSAKMLGLLALSACGVPSAQEPYAANQRCRPDSTRQIVLVADGEPRAAIVVIPDAAFGETELKERFGEQEFWPRGGFILRTGQRLPNLVWEHPGLVAKVVDDPTISTRWFNERFEEVKTAQEPGRYYAYGETLR